MGLFDWYPFIRRKGFNPALLYYTLLASIETVGRRRLDVLGTCFSTIKDSYTKHSPEIAHEKLMREIERYGTTDNMTLYIDGPQAVEKMWTAQTREAKREKAMVRLDGNLDAFASRMNNGLRMKKQQFIAIKKDLGLSFYWSLESRAEFVEYMRDLGWTVVFCDTEADVRLARDAEPGDVIISRDSDMLGYANIKTIWRPVSKSLILVYNMSDVLKAIGLSRNQLTALAVVSRNDYQRNIYSLGPATNLGIIKKIEDSRRIVATYLSDSKVLSRNEQQETFQNSMRVFIDMVQTPVMMQAPTEDGSLSPPAQDRLRKL
ncbi:MAG: hypothetical protein J3R72DRAFT_61852 [Linnemannia gamsii]|nr:MAG: hypothetical protein J3R72DRAFT_61852 [Linnemannia gamsii]